MLMYFRYTSTTASVSATTGTLYVASSGSTFVPASTSAPPALPTFITNPPAKHSNTGVIAGVVVAVLVLLIAAVVGGLFCLRRRRRRKAEAHDPRPFLLDEGGPSTLGNEVKGGGGGVKVVVSPSAVGTPYEMSDRFGRQPSPGPSSLTYPSSSDPPVPAVAVASAPRTRSRKSLESRDASSIIPPSPTKSVPLAPPSATKIPSSSPPIPSLPPGAARPLPQPPFAPFSSPPLSSHSPSPPASRADSNEITHQRHSVVSPTQAQQLSSPQLELIQNLVNRNVSGTAISNVINMMTTGQQQPSSGVEPRSEGRDGPWSSVAPPAYE